LVLWGFVWLTWIAWVRGRLLAGYAVGLLPWGGYLALRLHAYGRLVPNTFFAKLEPTAAPLSHGLAEVGLWVAVHAPLAALAMLPRRERVPAPGSPMEPLCLGWMIALSGFVVAAGGDWMGESRYLAPGVPLLALLAARRRQGTRARGVLAAALLAGAALGVIRRDTLPTYTREGVLLGAWLAEAADPRDEVALSAAGAVAYGAGLPVIDVLGITDATVAGVPARHAGAWAPGHHRYDLDRVLARRPRWIVWDYGVRANEARLRRLRDRAVSEDLDYRQALLARPDFRASYRVEHAAPRRTQDVYTVFRRAGP
jgi:hypothetical protein